MRARAGRSSPLSKRGTKLRRSRRCGAKSAARRPRSIERFVDDVCARWHAIYGDEWDRSQTFDAAKRELRRLANEIEKLRIAAEDPFAPGAAKALATYRDRLDLTDGNHPFFTEGHDLVLETYAEAILHGADEKELARLRVETAERKRQRAADEAALKAPERIERSFQAWLEFSLTCLVNGVTRDCHRVLTTDERQQLVLKLQQLLGIEGSV